MAPAQFKTGNGITLSGLGLDQYCQLWKAMIEEYGLTEAHLIEASAISMAMVVRSALGLTASGGQILCFVEDAPSGWVALAAVRHLISAGTNAGVIMCSSNPDFSPSFSRELKILKQMKVAIEPLDTLALDDLQTLLESCHNAICGLFSRSSHEVPESLTNLFNECHLPIHCIEAPIGVDPNTGKPIKDPLFASSTLSLGAPFRGLFEGSDYVGRHYVCGLSVPAELYMRFGEDLTTLFADQPVIQIFPIKDEEKIDLPENELIKS